MSDEAPRRLDGVRACVFDAYGTLFDFASAAGRSPDVPEDRRAALTTLWRDKQLQYTWLRSLQDRYADFRQVTADALDFALESLGLDAPGLRETSPGALSRPRAFPGGPRDLARTAAARFPDRHPVERNARHARGARYARRSGRRV